jgi:RecG-like helicase
MALFAKAKVAKAETEAAAARQAAFEANATQGTMPIGEVVWRERVKVAGEVQTVRIMPWAGGVATLEATLKDPTGGITLVFLGRQKVPGVGLGTRLVAEGMVGDTRGRLAIMNPDYTILETPELHH